MGVWVYSVKPVEVLLTDCRVRTSRTSRSFISGIDFSNSLSNALPFQWRRFNFFDKEVVKEPEGNTVFDKLAVSKLFSSWLSSHISLLILYIRVNIKYINPYK